jgi:protein ImuA
MSPALSDKHAHSPSTPSSFAVTALLALAAPAAAAHVSASLLTAAVAGVRLSPHDTTPSLQSLHPALWRAHQLGSARDEVLPSSFAALDAQLPGGGWPTRVLTELLLPHAGVGELRLLAPLLAALQVQQRSVMWLDPPAAPCPWALAALGLDLQQLIVVRARNPACGGARAGLRSPARKLLPAADMLWALEQALKSGHLGAVLAWLPARLPADALRRLQLAAQAHDGPVFLLRDAQMRSQASAAPLRLLLASAEPDVLRVTVLKRRGPPLLQPLHLALAPVLSAPELARAAAVRRLPAAEFAASSAVAPPSATSTSRAAWA